MVNKRLKFVFKVLVSCLFTGYIIFKIDWSVLVNALLKVELVFYLESTLLVIITVIVIAYKYYLLVKNTSISRSLVSLIKINFVSRYYALFLPAGVGMEAVRWYKVTRNEKGRVFFAASIVFERSISIFLLLLSGIIPLFLYSSNPEIVKLREFISPIILVFLILTMATIAYFIFPVLQEFAKSVLIRVLPSHGKWRNVLLFFENLNLKNPSLVSFGYLLALSILWQLFNVGRIFSLSQALVLPLSFIDIVWISSLVLLLQVIPISFAGIGVREGAYAYLFTLFGLSSEQGVSLGILAFSQMILLSIIGGLLDWREK